MKRLFLSLNKWKKFEIFLNQHLDFKKEDFLLTPPLLKEPLKPLWIILIRAGSASLGFFYQKKIVLHKRITAYMTRKKQGKAQLTYLKTKGKSRAGSRHRLKESYEFFEQINQKLQRWNKKPLKPQEIYYFCPVGLKNLWFSSKIPPPFDKKDVKLKKLPFYFNKPTHQELKKAFWLLNAFCITGHNNFLDTLWQEFLKTPS